MTESRALILFARAPVAGQVKTRLEPVLGPDGTLGLYRRLLDRQLSLVNAFAAAEPLLFVDGDIDHEAFASFPSRARNQQGRDIGERMAHALEFALARYGSVVLIGCDCPEMDKGLLESAFKVLNEGVDVVLGPALDGGYVLVGLNSPCREMFREIHWGSPQVLTHTLERLDSLGRCWETLPPIHDVDEPGDLAWLREAFPELLPVPLPGS